MFGNHDHPRWGSDGGSGSMPGAAPTWPGHRGPGRRARLRRGPFGPGPGGPRRGGHGGKGRRARGDVRLAVLALLTEEPMHGYQILQEIGTRTDGAWQPSPGSVYPTVSQLADEGLVRTEKSEGRSVVHLTDEGRRWVEAHRAELDAVWSTAAAEDGFASLREAGAGLMGALQQVATVGSAEQVAEAGRLVDDTRRRLYLLLAGESPGATQEPRDES